MARYKDYPETEYISDDSDDWDEEALEEQQVNAVPVHVIKTDTEIVAPQYANLMTWGIPQFGVAQGSQPTYVQILQKRQNRYKAKFFVSLGSATAIALATDPAKLTGVTSAPGVGQSVFLVTLGGGSIPDYDSERPLYAVAIGGANATISVLDETYGQQQ